MLILIAFQNLSKKKYLVNRKIMYVIIILPKDIFLINRYNVTLYLSIKKI